MCRRPLVDLVLTVLLAVAAADCGAAQRRRARRDQQPPATATAPAAATAPLAARITTLKQGGGRLAWHDDHIAFDMAGPDGVFDVYVMKADGTSERCLTCGHPDLPPRNIGQPAWHPSGRYLVFQAEKAAHRPLRLPSAVAPGAGVLNDLWVLDLESNRATRIREVADAPGQGTLHPHFSPDGRTLGWSEMNEPGGLKRGKELGYWDLMMANFRVDAGRPRLADVRTITPGGPGFYENHGFSPDGSRLLFSSNFEATHRLQNEIYELDLGTQRLRRLTSGGWNEHARYSPDGRTIAWMSNGGRPLGGADYWLMNSDGSNQRRLTFFNERGHPHYTGRRTMVADLDWRPDGRAIAGYTGGKILTTSSADPSRIILIELAAN
jgi:Tol biopolymer transport system component